MDVMKVAACKTKPIREFVTAKDKPNLIGVRNVGIRGGRYWFSETHIVKTIKHLEAELAFWREMLEVLKEI